MGLNEQFVQDHERTNPGFVETLRKSSFPSMTIVRMNLRLETKNLHRPLRSLPPVMMEGIQISNPLLGMMEGEIELQNSPRMMEEDSSDVRAYAVDEHCRHCFDRPQHREMPQMDKETKDC